MKEEFVNALMEKYSFFYRDPEKKVYKKYPKQAISKEVGDEWYGKICKLCEELYWYFKEIEYHGLLHLIQLLQTQSSVHQMVCSYSLIRSPSRFQGLSPVH